MRRRTWGFITAASALIVGVVVVPSAVSSAAQPIPSLRLVSVLHTADLEREAGSSEMFVSLGAYLESVDGPFELRAKRLTNGSIDVTQVHQEDNGDLTVLRHLPSDSGTNFSDGLGHFTHLAWRNSSNAVVAQADAAFCPVGFSMSRIDDSGPLVPQYPSFCGSSLTQGAVWGIDKGWAVRALEGAIPNPNIPDGTYTLEVSVASKWATALGMTSNTPAAVTVTLSTFTPCDDDACPGAAPRTAGAAAAAPAVPGQIAPAATPAGPRPDLIPLPAYGPPVAYHLGPFDFLAFAANVWNAGAGPLLVEGFRSSDELEMPVTQYFTQGGVVVDKANVGTFDYDDRRGHHHWHFEDFAKYELVNISSGSTVVSGKQSFCLAPTDAIDLTVEGASWQTERSDLSSSCGDLDSIWIREALPSGWGDTYIQSRAGQAFNITKVPNGLYYIRVTTNPENELFESDYTNNVSLLQVKLAGPKGHRTVQVIN